MRIGLWGAHPRPPHYGAGVSLTVFSLIFSGPYQLSYFWLFCFLPKMKMKVKKEIKRFNAETVVANYRFGTWNIGTLKGKSGEVCKVLCRRKVKVCCIQEVRWKGEGSRALQGYKLIWKGNSEGTAGVGVLVASELADRIIRVERISDRVIAVDLVIGEQIVKVVSCYAPQAGRSQIEKEEFWRQVEGVIMNTNINQEVIVCGDMNGHVDQVANGFHEAHGNFGYGTRNAEGERILEFAEAMGYVVTNTLFKKRQSHLVTESGGNKTAVDMILIKREHKKRIMNTSDTRRGMCPWTPSCGNGHAFKGYEIQKKPPGIAQGATQDKGMETEETRGKEGIFRKVTRKEYRY